MVRGPQEDAAGQVLLLCSSSTCSSAITSHHGDNEPTVPTPVVWVVGGVYCKGYNDLDFSAIK